MLSHNCQLLKPSLSYGTIVSVNLVVTIYCQLCDVSCNGEESYNLHCAGKQHCKVCSLCDISVIITVAVLVAVIHFLINFGCFQHCR